MTGINYGYQKLPELIPVIDIGYCFTVPKSLEFILVIGENSDFHSDYRTYHQTSFQSLKTFPVIT